MKAHLFVTGVIVDAVDVTLRGASKNYVAGHMHVEAIDERGEFVTWDETVDPSVLGTWIEREVEPASWKVVRP